MQVQSIAPAGASQRFRRPAHQASSRVRGPAQIAHPRNGSSAEQKRAHWLARAADAERIGDAVDVELCRQYAEHWLRVSLGQR